MSKNTERPDKRVTDGGGHRRALHGAFRGDVSENQKEERNQ